MRALLAALLGAGLLAPATTQARPLPHGRAASHAGGVHPVERRHLDTRLQALAKHNVAARVEAARSGAKLVAARRRAATDAARATALSQATVAAAARVQDTERDTAHVAEQTQALVVQQEEARQALQDAERALEAVLPVAVRLSLFPSETLLATQRSADDSLAGLMVLRGLGSALEREARSVRDAQERLAATGTALGSEQARLVALQQRQAGQQARLALQAQAAQATQRASMARAEQAAQVAADAVARAATLGDAVTRVEAAERAAQARFEQQAEAAEAARQPDAAQRARDNAASLLVPAGPGLQQGAGPEAALGHAPGGAPVAGRIAQAFGSRGDAGPASGVTYAPPSLATVTAPCAGRIEFAGPFRSYGRMLILNCGRDYRFVLAGLDRLDVSGGQNLARGAVVGRMPGWSGGSGQGRPSLYMQLRHGDATIDPRRFLQGPR